VKITGRVVGCALALWSVPCDRKCKCVDTCF